MQPIQFGIVAPRKTQENRNVGKHMKNRNENQMN